MRTSTLFNLISVRSIKSFMISDLAPLSQNSALTQSLRCFLHSYPSLLNSSICLPPSCLSYFGPDATETVTTSTPTPPGRINHNDEQPHAILPPGGHIFSSAHLCHLLPWVLGTSIVCVDGCLPLGTTCSFWFCQLRLHLYPEDSGSLDWHRLGLGKSPIRLHNLI